MLLLPLLLCFSGSWPCRAAHNAISPWSSRESRVSGCVSIQQQLLRFRRSHLDERGDSWNFMAGNLDRLTSTCEANPAQALTATRTGLWLALWIRKGRTAARASSLYCCSYLSVCCVLPCPSKFLLPAILRAKIMSHASVRPNDNSQKL
jgi:hypothetical protein